MNSAPTEGRGDVREDRFDDMGIVVDGRRGQNEFCSSLGGYRPGGAVRAITTGYRALSFR